VGVLWASLKGRQTVGWWLAVGCALVLTLTACSDDDIDCNYSPGSAVKTTLTPATATEHP
jgi:hypothetical protein